MLQNLKIKKVFNKKLYRNLVVSPALDCGLSFGLSDIVLIGSLVGNVLCIMVTEFLVVSWTLLQSVVAGEISNVDVHWPNDTTTTQTWSNSTASTAASRVLPKIAAAPPLFRSAPSKIRQDLGALPIFISADRVSKLLRNFANEEMGAYFLQSKFDAMVYQTENNNMFEDASTLADTLAQLISECVTAVNLLKTQVLSVFSKSPYDMHAFRQYRECCSIDPQLLNHSPEHGAFVNTSISCDVVPHGLSAFSFYPGQNLSETFVHNTRGNVTILWQYFISSDGLRTEFPSNRIDERNYTSCEMLARKHRREIFASSIFGYPKQVVILIDHSRNLSEQQLLIAKCVAQTLINLLGEGDELLLLGVSDKVSMSSGVHCPNVTAAVTAEVKADAERFVEELLPSGGVADHEMALKVAYKVIAGRKFDKLRRQPMIIFISAGLEPELLKNHDMLQKSRNRYFDTRVKLFSFHTVDSEWSISKNPFNYSDAIFEHGKVIWVNMTNKECLPLKSLMAIFGGGEMSKVDEIKFRTVGSGYLSSRAVLLVSKQIYVDDSFVGFVGVEADLAELVAPVVFYSSGDTTSYAFLFSLDGLVVAHPHFLSLPTIRAVSMHISMVEKHFPFSEWKQSFKTRNHGQILQLAKTADGNRTETDIIYYWKAVQGTPYILVISSKERVSVERSNRPEFSDVLTRSLAYHRLDLHLSKDFDLCLHGKMLASTGRTRFDRVGLYLAPRSFKEPMKRFLVTESKRTAQGFWAFVSDVTRLITNPGLQLNIRREICALREMASEWQRLAKEGQYPYSVLRRYLATPSGVFLSYPAVLMNQHFDPVQREWFQRAARHPSKVVITGPVVDPSGFGHIVSLSHTVYEGKAAAMHHIGDPVVAVLGLDVSLTFLFKMLYNHLTVCREIGIDCFLFDDRGYIVAHNNVHPFGDVIRRQEGLHITHREPFIASEILQNSEFVRKVVCLRFSDRTVQRMYIFNTSFEDVMKNSDGCLKYQIAVVPQTNVFLAIVNRSCHKQSAFCPCSVTDRRCLNCYRSEATECECPCECPIDSLQCPKIDGKPTELPICPAAVKDTLLASPDMQFFDVNTPLLQCKEINCADFKTQASCAGVVGCEWCYYDLDRVNQLPTPYCASVHVCFSGFLGLSPLGNVDQEFVNSKFATSTPVGPVAGGIMAVFILLVAGVYWYRQQVNRIMENRCYRLSDSSATRLNVDLEEDFHFDDGSSNAQHANGAGTTQSNSGLLLASFERQNLISMPRPRSRWRPGPRTESSDPGYSTMTANCDDSEQATTVELGSPGFGSYRRSQKDEEAVAESETETAASSAVGGNSEIAAEVVSEKALKKFNKSNELVITAQIHASAS
ncbi:VWFA and cache domain-containing protein 1 [Trichinella pseudospiralis]|uniref:VWFA and cache domain-containing protein 1 n=1 Tax=Trichinella pseudospiralis TaxID=6337 RepID=A0A0V1IRJ3_TRIPS|nr:VWFA and cache domain-containing protein 1 [Trichinella pseudospiralis]